MEEAVGMVEVRGWPPALAAADAMVKAANVMLVGYEKLSGAFYTVIVRGSVSEVKVSVEAGVEAVKKVQAGAAPGEKLLLSYHLIPRPSENISHVLLPKEYDMAIEAFRVRG